MTAWPADGPSRRFERFFRRTAIESNKAAEEAEAEIPPPFVLELRGEDVRENDAFTPAAAVLMTPVLRGSDLLRSLKPEEAVTLLLVLSCVTGHGSFAAAPELLAPALGVSVPHALARLRGLARKEWRGEPLLLESATETGLRLFAPSPALFTVRRSWVYPATAAGLDTPQGRPPEPEGAAASRRNAVIAYSRNRYGRPRAEVEAEINRFLAAGKGDISKRVAPQGTASPLEPSSRKQDLYLVRRLTAWGVPLERAHQLVAAYPEERIEAQLAYLPYRTARNPASFLAAAIERDFAPPKDWSPDTIGPA